MGTSGRIVLVLAAALAALLGPVRTADAKRTIALLEIEGARTDKLRRSLKKMISKDHKVVDEDKYRRAARRLKAKKINPAHIRKVCEHLQVDAVLEGQIVAIEGGYRLILRLHDGVTGKRVWRQPLKLRRQSFSKKIAPKLKARILRNIARLEQDSFGDDSFDDMADEDDEADEDEADDGRERETARERRARKRREARERRREARERKRQERERAKERARQRREERKRKRKERREAAADDDDEFSGDDDFEDDDEFSGDDDFEDDSAGDDDFGEEEFDDGDQVAAADGDKEEEDDFDEDPLMTGKSSESDSGSFEADPRERPLVIWAGGSASGRKLQFTFSGLVGDERPPRYKGTPVPGVYLAGELFPLAFSPGPKSTLRNIGFGFVFDRVIKLDSTVQDTEGNALADVATTQQRLGVNVKYRHFLNDSPRSPMVLVTAGYNQRKFVLDKASVGMGTVIDVPNTTYTYVDPGLGFRTPVFGKISFSAEARALLVLDAGEIQNPEQYGAATLTGVDGDVALDYQINRQFSVRLGVHAMTLGYDFKEDTGALQDRNGDGNADVGGARDNWYGGYVTVGYAYK